MSRCERPGAPSNDAKEMHIIFGVSCGSDFYGYSPEFNIDPKRWRLEDYFPFKMLKFQGLCETSLGYQILWQPSNVTFFSRPSCHHFTETSPCPRTTNSTKQVQTVRKVHSVRNYQIVLFAGIRANLQKQTGFGGKKLKLYL